MVELVITVTMVITVTITHISFVYKGFVDGGHEPRDSEAEENVDGVGAGDVSDSSVSCVFVHGGDLTGERVGKRCSQGNCGWRGLETLLLTHKALHAVSCG